MRRGGRKAVKVTRSIFHGEYLRVIHRHTGHVTRNLVYRRVSLVTHKWTRVICVSNAGTPELNALPRSYASKRMGPFIVKPLHTTRGTIRFVYQAGSESTFNAGRRF